MLTTLALFALSATNRDWPTVGNDPGAQRYSPLTDINPRNVKRLRMAWVYHTGDMRDQVSRSVGWECTPIFVDGRLYGITPYSKVFALDPDTGKAQWTFDPEIDRQPPAAVETFASRGVATWKDPATGRRRILVATYDARLIALDARTGKPIPSFGTGGAIQLRIGVGGRYIQHYVETSPPCVIGNLVVVGSSIGDNFAVDMPSGKVRAYEVKTGKLVWTWEPLASERAKHAGLRTGAGNAWITMSADPARGLIFVPTGSPSPDYSGVTRPGDDRDADSIVCLRAKTGQKVWAFQVVHHDLWDYDVPAQPIVATIKGRRAVIAMTKMGHVFVLDEATGKPLLPVAERPVPASHVRGETASPTQPIPIRPPALSPSIAKPWGPTPELRKAAATRMASLRSEGIFTPPSLDGSIVYPGGIGGCDWSGGCYLPALHRLFVPTNSLANAITLVTSAPKASGDRFSYSAYARQEGSPYGVVREWLFGPGNIPMTAPPFGSLTCVDVASGSIDWTKPLGWMPGLSQYPGYKGWGSPNLGGAMATASGLIFIAATDDCHFRAFDARTGRICWDHALPAGGNAGPMSFRSAKGRHYIVLCVGGHSGLHTPPGDSVIAFCLP